ncbi:MAG: heavy metal translocating P-type ATPase [bacterium]
MRANGWMRQLWLPATALGFLVAGAAFWLLASLRIEPALAPFAPHVWLIGLILTGAPVVWTTLRQAMRGHFATDLVASLSVVGAVILGEPMAGLVIVIMQSGGEALERVAEGRASAAVRELEEAAPRVAHLLRDGVVADVPVDEVVVGDELLVRPGELIPCDAVVVTGESPVDVSRLTGEPLPIAATKGTALPSGSANGDAPLTVRATSVAQESQYARIVELVRSAQASKAPLQRLADRYAVWFTPATLLVCAIAWWWSGDPRRALAVLVVATPCPLILATPIAIIGGINRAARRQIIMRNGSALEQLSAATVAIFDKTGTLTIGRPEVESVESLGAWTERDLLRLAGAVEQGSSHLLARTFAAAAARALTPIGLRIPGATNVTEAAGRGITGEVEGHRVTIGAWAYLRDLYPAAVPALLEHEIRVASKPGLRAYIAIDGLIAGRVEYADHVRDEAHAVVAELASLGVRRQVLLSGDNASSVEAIARVVGLSEFQSDCLPQDKARFVTALINGGDRVLMVGDGINDAPALSAANVGIALAAHGGGISAEAADVVLLADHLDRVPEAIRISHRTMRIARQSIGVGLGLSGIAMVVAAAGGLPPAIGAALQEVIDVAVIVNALRTSR